MATQAEAGRGLSLAKTRDWLAVAAAVAVVIGALAAGMQWAVSSAVAPLYAEIRGIDNRLNGIDNRMDRIENQLEILPELRERLTRLETILLERDRDAP